MACPPNSFSYNSSSSSSLLCACDPGRYLNPSGECVIPPEEGLEITSSSIGERQTFLSYVFSLGVVRSFTEWQAIFLWSTGIGLVSWLLLCAALRFAPLRDGRSIWFRIRWWIARLDVSYATHHWLSDGKAVRKRRTELGGICSMASWILFSGLLSSLLYQLITKRTIEVQRMRSFTAADLKLFKNDFEFTITAISGMSCSQLRGPETVVTGTPGSIDHRVFALTSFASYLCRNTSRGPAITITCNNCRFPRGILYTSWKFIDLPGNPASAVAFRFNLTTRDHSDGDRLSFVNGTVKSGSYSSNMPATFRGPDSNVLKIHLFPQVYRNLNNLSIIQPLFNDFLPGSSFLEASRLRVSLENPNDGLIDTTLYLSFLSDYLVEIDKERIMGPVSFLADVGGVYVISAAIFLFLMLQLESRSKRLRNEENIYHNIIVRKRAQRNWDKVRKYVIYTWGCENLEGHASSSQRRDIEMPDCLCLTGSLPRRKQRKNDLKNKPIQGI